ncbi:triphosphoribosyl-dephospho-CoA synthase, partial [Enterobacter asburiae]
GQETAGERQFQQYGLTGARGEAESGFATARKALAQWNGQSLHGLLLRLMAVNQDSNLVSRGGIEGLRYVQGYAQELLASGWDREALLKMDNALIVRNLSPGGSADLLSVGWVLSAIK